MSDKILIIKIYLLFLHSVFLFYTALKAQIPDSLQSLYNNQSLYRYGNNFLKGSEKLTYRELKKEFSMSDIGLDAYRQSKKIPDYRFDF